MTEERRISVDTVKPVSISKEDAIVTLQLIAKFVRTGLVDPKELLALGTLRLRMVTALKSIGVDYDEASKNE